MLSTYCTVGWTRCGTAKARPSACRSCIFWRMCTKSSWWRLMCFPGSSVFFGHWATQKRLPNSLVGTDYYCWPALCKQILQDPNSPRKHPPGLQVRIDNENCREGGGLTVQFSRCVACSSSIVGRCSLLGIDQSSPLYCPKKNQKTRANLRLPHPHARAPMQVSPSQFASPAAVLSEVQNVIDAHGGASEFALALICHIASVLNWHGKPWSPELW